MKYERISVSLPTLEKAKELTKHYNRTLNNDVLIINTVAPMVTKGGVNLGETAHKDEQAKLNKLGMLVVYSPFKRKEGDSEITPHAVYEGEIIKFRQDSQPSFVEVITTKELQDGLVLAEGTEPDDTMYKKYVVMSMSIHNIVCVLNQ